MSMTTEDSTHRNRFLTCEKCKSKMHQTNTYQSGNSIYAEYQCDKCMNRIVKCLGVK